MEDRGSIGPVGPTGPPGRCSYEPTTVQQSYTIIDGPGITLPGDGDIKIQIN